MQHLFFVTWRGDVMRIFPTHEYFVRISFVGLFVSWRFMAFHPGCVVSTGFFNVHFCMLLFQFSITIIPWIHITLLHNSLLESPLKPLAFYCPAGGPLTLKPCAKYGARLAGSSSFRNSVEALPYGPSSVKPRRWALI